MGKRKQTVAELETEALREAADAAESKREAGEKLSQRERRAIAKWAEHERRRHFEEVARSCPQNQLCELTGLSRKVLLEWERDGLPRNTNKGRTYNLYAVLPWMRARLMKFGENTPAGQSRMNAQTRRELAQAELRELEVDAKKGHLVEREIVEAQQEKFATAIRNGFAAVASSVAPRCEGLTAREIESVIRAEIDGVLIQLAETKGDGP